MASNMFRSSNSRLGAAIVVLGFLALEAAIGGRAIMAGVQQAAHAESASVSRFVFR